MSVTVLLVTSACSNKIDHKKDYRVKDIVKTNSEFDTKALFSTKIEYEDVEFAFPESCKGIRAIKYNGVDYLGQPTRIFAHIGIPQTPMPKNGYPAVVLAHGASGRAFAEWVKEYTDRGYVAISPDLDSQQSTALNTWYLNPEGGARAYNMREDVSGDFKDSSFYFNISNLILANNLLRSLPEVDSKNIGLCGVSWGGMYALIVAGIDKRFEAFTIFYSSAFIERTPFGDGHLHGFTPEMMETYKTLFDSQTYIPYSARPMLFTCGTDDGIFSMKEIQNTADITPGKAFYSYKYSMPHDHETGWWSLEQFAFFDHILKNENSMIITDNIEIKDGIARFSYKGNPRIENVQMVYTTNDVSKGAHWNWSTKCLSTIEFMGQNIFAVLPENTTAIFFEITDNNNVTVSTEIKYV